MTPDMESTYVSNPLDEEQEQFIQRMESAQRRSRIMTTLQRQRDYVFTPPDVEERIRQIVGRKLVGWAIGPEATTPEDIATRKALREKYLEPHRTTARQYKARLVKQAHVAPVPPIKGVPILLFAREMESEEDNAFIRCVHKARCLSSMWALRASASLADVRIERNLRYDFVKLKSNDQLRAMVRSIYASGYQCSRDFMPGLGRGLACSRHYW